MFRLVCVLTAVLWNPVWTIGPNWNGLRARFVPNYSEQDPEGFYAIPRTIEEATEAAGWTIYLTAPDDGDYLGRPLTFMDDTRFAVLLDDNGYVCGVQIGIPVAEVDTTDNPYNFNKDIFQKVTRLGEEIYLVTLYTVDPSVIRSGGRSEEDFQVQGTGTALYIQEGSSDNIRKLSAPPEGDPLYTLEGCVPMMGTHYYYNMTRNLRCEDFFPIFLLHDNNEMIGFGFQTFGTVTPRGRQWFENIPVAAIQAALYEYPECLTQLLEELGLVSLHVYFKDDPWNIRCPSRRHVQLNRGMQYGIGMRGK